MWKNYINATTIEEVLEVLAQEGEKARIVAGGTDLVLELERGQRKGIETLVDVSRIPGLDGILMDEDGTIHMGPLVTHNHCVGSKLIQEYALPLALAAWEVGSPQIRNRGTVAGNLITASPANDTISPLMALGAKLRIRSAAGERVVDLAEFYTGVRKTVMRPDEMVVDIFFPAMRSNQRGMFIKFALRRAQAISLVNVAVVVSLEGGIVQKAIITLGAVAPVIIHAVKAEQFLVGKALTPEVIEQAGELAREAAKPINDLRSSAVYRSHMARLITKRALEAIQNHTEHAHLPESPILLWGKPVNVSSRLEKMSQFDGTQPIETTINGKRYSFASGHEKTLLHLLREDGGLIGSKEGCGEGECGACTLFLDGIAVMGCLVPAGRAHGADIRTIEGISEADTLHPVQEAFVTEDAVQCGYCTPGFVMSAVKLLEERPHPTLEEIQQGITGNLCRCTGYYKIIQAIDKAAQRG